jgi:hypothetical protein
MAVIAYLELRRLPSPLVAGLKTKIETQYFSKGIIGPNLGRNLWSDSTTNSTTAPNGTPVMTRRITLFADSFHFPSSERHRIDGTDCKRPFSIFQSFAVFRTARQPTEKPCAKAKRIYSTTTHQASIDHDSWPPRRRRARCDTGASAAAKPQACLHQERTHSPRRLAVLPFQQGEYTSAPTADTVRGFLRRVSRLPGQRTLRPAA